MTGQSRPNPAVRAVSRWKVTEPVRLYLYGILAAVCVVLLAAGFITQDMSAALTGLAAAVLVAVPAAVAIRPSVYSLAGHINSLRQLRSAADVQAALDVPLDQKEAA